MNLIPANFAGIAKTGNYANTGSTSGTPVDENGDPTGDTEPEDQDPDFTITVVDHPDCTETVFGEFVDCIKTSIELMRFDGEVREEGNFLFWTTATEVGNEYFSLQRLGEDSQFHEIALIGGSGTINTEVTYNYLDQNPKGPTNYYRLVSVDVHGEEKESNVIVLSRTAGTASDFSITPVPSSRYINIHYYALQREIIVASVFNAAGQLMEEKHFSVGEGIQTLNWDISVYLDGIYFMSIASEEETISKRFIIYRGLIVEILE